METERTGAQKAVEIMLKHGTKHAFVYPGGAFAFIMDEIVKEGTIKLINMRNDQAASLAADAYSRAIDGTGICMATSGPGATNLITGIANAYFDSVPMIIITGQVGTGDLKGKAKVRQRGFQEADIVSMVKPITKWATLVTDTKDIEYALEKAYHIANEGRKGPVLLDIPMNVQSTKISEKDFKKFKAPKAKKYKMDEKTLHAFKEMVMNAKRPVFLVGGGVISANASDEMRKLADKLQIPVATSLMGKGVYPEGSDLSLGMIGYAGSRACNFTIHNSDLVIGVGSRFDIRQTGGLIGEFAKKAKIIQIDIDENQIGNRIRYDLKVVGDAKQILTQLNKLFEGENVSGKWNEWHGTVMTWKKEYGYSYSDNSPLIKPQKVVEEVCKLDNGKTIITADVGQNQMWVAQFYKFKAPRMHLTSAGHGTMGFGLPAAIAAKLARPECRVINITGDGSFQMNIQELETILYYKLPVKVIILNNGCLGLVRQFQEYSFEKRYTCTKEFYSAPDFIKIAKAYGVDAHEITKKEDLAPMLKKAIESERPAVINIAVDPEEGVLPMLLGGKKLNDQHPSIDYKPELE